MVILISSSIMFLISSLKRAAGPSQMTPSELKNLSNIDRWQRFKVPWKTNQAA